MQSERRPRVVARRLPRRRPVRGKELKGFIRERVRASLRVTASLLDPAAVAAVAAVAAAVVEAYRRGRKVVLFGNGGSAADAQHIAAELVGRYYQNRPPLPALALHTNTSSLTAIGNDYSFAEVFARPVEALVEAGDIAVGISTSGDSENVLEAVKAAKRKGATTIALTGASGGRLRELVDICASVPAEDTPRIQEAHILIGHIVCEWVERELFPQRPAS